MMVKKSLLNGAVVDSSAIMCILHRRPQRLDSPGEVPNFLRHQS